MIKKGELLPLLEKAIDTEEKAIPVYVKHLSNTLFLSDYSQKDQTRVKDILAILSQESEGHRKIYQVLIEKISQSNQDVY